MLMPREASLARNLLNGLDASLGPRVRRLDLADNQLASLGAAFQDCSALEHLGLANNRLTSLAGKHVCLQLSSFADSFVALHAC